LVRQGAFASAHIREKDCFPQSTLVSPTRLADRTSMRGPVTLDVVLVFKTALVLNGRKAGLQVDKMFMTHSLR
jgi:hypothetical protein